MSLSCSPALRDRAITYRFNPLYYSGPQTLISEYAVRGPWTRDHIPRSLPAERDAHRFNIRSCSPALWSMWSLQWAAAMLSPKSCPPRRRRGPPPLNRSVFYTLSDIIYPRQFPLDQRTRLMQTFNMLFTHKKQAICVSGRKINGPPLPSARLYLTLTIWIANRTIYHESRSFILC